MIFSVDWWRSIMLDIQELQNMMMLLISVHHLHVIVLSAAVSQLGHLTLVGG
jgi:hypothetical protein